MADREIVELTPLRHKRKLNQILGQPGKFFFFQSANFQIQDLFFFFESTEKTDQKKLIKKRSIKDKQTKTQGARISSQSISIQKIR